MLDKFHKNLTFLPPPPSLHVSKMIYAFSFWMLLRQQLIEKEEEQQLKVESLHEIKSTSMKSFSILLSIITGAAI